MFRLLVVLVVLAMCCSAVEVNRTAEGYPAGYLSICPGFERQIRIPRKLLNRLQFVVEGRADGAGGAGGAGYRQYRRSYGYSGAARGLAADPHVDLRRRTVLFVSGWLDATPLPIPRLMAAAYMPLHYNVILLDTNRFTTYAYPTAARLSKDVGRRAAEVLVEMVRSYGLDPKRVELVGLSLGGHVVGHIGKTFRQLTGTRLARITGLDPAGPCFRYLPPPARLDRGDADRVDVLHTNIDGFGVATPLGHVDFYINGGEYQASEFAEFPCPSLCSHIRVFFLWLVTLEYPESFVGVRCDTVQEARDGACFDKRPQVTNVMGPNTDFGKPGIYYLATRNTYPYHLGENGLRKEFELWKSPLLAPSVGDIAD